MLLRSLLRVPRARRYAIHRPSIAPPPQRVAPVAGCRARMAAVALDFALYLALSPFTIGSVAVFLRSFWWLGAIAVALAYLAVTWSGGASLGMRLTGIRAVDPRSGREPGFARAFLRAALALPPFVALFVLVNGFFAASPHPLLDEPLLALGSLALLLGGVASELWVLVDPRGQSLLDRVTGFSIVRAPRGRAPDRAHEGTRSVSPL